jgi:hypothetical protein
MLTETIRKAKDPPKETPLSLDISVLSEAVLVLSAAVLVLSAAVLVLSAAVLVLSAAVLVLETRRKRSKNPQRWPSGSNRSFLIHE